MDAAKGYRMNLASFQHRRLCSLLFLLVGLGSACAEPEPLIIDECVGELQVTVPLEAVPSKVRIEWRSGTRDLEILDECTAPHARLLVERRVGALLINDGGFGYRPPPTFDLKVLDRGDCLGNAPDLSLIDVANVPVPGPRDLCVDTEVTLPSR